MKQITTAMDYALTRAPVFTIFELSIDRGSRKAEE